MTIRAREFKPTAKPFVTSIELKSYNPGLEFSQLLGPLARALLQ